MPSKRTKTVPTARTPAPAAGDTAPAAGTTAPTSRQTLVDRTVIEPAPQTQTETRILPSPQPSYTTQNQISAPQAQKSCLNVPPIEDETRLIRVPMHEYKRLKDETNFRIGHSGSYVEHAPAPKLWVDYRVEDWHQAAEPVIKHLQGDEAFKKRFLNQKFHCTKNIDTEGAVAVVGERHLFGEVIEAFNDWLFKVHNHSAKVFYERTHIITRKDGKDSSIRPDITVETAKPSTSSDNQTRRPLFAADFKKAGSIQSAGFNSRCKNETEAKDLVGSARFTSDMKRPSLGENYAVIVQKGTGYALALSVPVVCIYDYHTLVIQYCPGVDRDVVPPFKGNYGFRTFVRDKDLHAVAVLGALVRAAEDQGILKAPTADGKK